jgi:hypothetical protein
MTLVLDIPRRRGPKRKPCGTFARYQGGCRCDACTVANRLEWRRKRDMKDEPKYPGTGPHGTVKRGYQGCPCALCVAAVKRPVVKRPPLAATRYRCRCGQLHQTPMASTCDCGHPIGWA